MKFGVAFATLWLVGKDGFAVEAAQCRSTRTDHQCSFCIMQCDDPQSHLCDWRAYCCHPGCGGGVWDIFDAGWGTCDTYAAGRSNHAYCFDDFDAQWVNYDYNEYGFLLINSGERGALALEACPSECDFREGNMCPGFDAGWGTCSTYARGHESGNHDYCNAHYDTWCKGNHRPIYAWMACPDECGFVVCPHVIDPYHNFCDCGSDCGTYYCACAEGRECCGN